MDIETFKILSHLPGNMANLSLYFLFCALIEPGLIVMYLTKGEIYVIKSSDD